MPPDDAHPPRDAAHLAPYARIKRHVLAQIDSGAWTVTSKVPSENQLAAEFGVSRMTARRALLELTQEGALVRSQGLGTFVADRKPLLPLLEVRNIADDIAERGHRYANRIIRLEPTAASEVIAVYLGVPAGATVYHSVIVHLENEVPVQLEDRHTNPSVAPHYLEQDFARETPNAYLTRIAPMTSVEHVVEAVLPTPEMAEWLELEGPEACLQINRRTWSRDQVVAYARLVHPGSRYRLGGYLALARGSTARRTNT